MSNKVYDVLKWIAQYFLPAIGTLYFALADTWGLPFAEEIVGTVVAVDTFLGVILGISTVQYTKKQAAEASKTEKLYFFRTRSAFTGWARPYIFGGVDFIGRA